MTILYDMSQSTESILRRQPVHQQNLIVMVTAQYVDITILLNSTMRKQSPALI